MNIHLWNERRIIPLKLAGSFESDIFLTNFSYLKVNETIVELLG